MELDAETRKEITAILARDCVVEVTIAFYDTSEVLEPTDIATTIEFEANTPVAEMREDLAALVEEVGRMLGTLTSPDGKS